MPKKGRAIGLGLLAVLAAAALAMLTLGRDSLPALGRLFSPGPGILDDPAGLVRRDMPAVPVLLQKPELPAGCEATAAAMLLGAYGYAVSKEEMARAIPRAPFEKRDGRVYGPDPRDMYAGDPFSAEGYGVYADPVAAAMQREIDRLGGGAPALRVGADRRREPRLCAVPFHAGAKYAAESVGYASAVPNRREFRRGGGHFGDAPAKSGGLFGFSCGAAGRVGGRLLRRTCRPRQFCVRLRLAE